MAGTQLSLRDAVALGLLEGPTELLPVSSSAHIALVPWLAGWSYPTLDPELRKSFEVALHIGAGLALAIDMRHELLACAAQLDGRRAGLIALSLAPPALAGYSLQRPIERRLGGPRSIAAGLLAGSVAMALADARAPGPRREEAQAGPLDGLALGLAQAAALIPGISRNGATLAAARMRGFGRRDARALSRHAALPVILGAGALKLAQSVRAGRAGGDRGKPSDALGAAPLAAGTAAAFLSTLAGARALRSGRGDDGPLLPYSLYRCLLAGLVLARARAGRTAQATHSVNR